MKWFKFLINFALFASAVLNIGSGISQITGLAYGEMADLVYRIFDGIQTLDIIVGIGLFAVAALAIYARIRLAGYRKNGPKALNAVYLATAAVQLIYIIGIFIIAPNGIAEEIDFSTNITSIAISIGMVSANTTYFKKRAHLFVND